MKKILWWLVLNGGFLAAVWFGFIEGVEGAQYLAKFWVWVVAFPSSLVVLTDGFQQKLSGEPPKPFRRTLAHMIAWFALGVFIWNGHIATAMAWGFWMLAGAIAREGAKKHAAGTSAAAAA